MNPRKLELLYDKDCPICARYAMYVDLQKRFDISLLNARDELKRIEELRKQGYNIESGFILIVDDKEVIQGHKAMLALESMTAPTGILDSFKKALLRVPGVGRCVYPVAKFVRHALLRFKGINPKIFID